MFAAHLNECTSCARTRLAVQAFEDRLRDYIGPGGECRSANDLGDLKRSNFKIDAGAFATYKEWHVLVCPECRARYERLHGTKGKNSLVAQGADTQRYSWLSLLPFMCGTTRDAGKSNSVYRNSNTIELRAPVDGGGDRCVRILYVGGSEPTSDVCSPHCRYNHQDYNYRAPSVHRILPSVTVRCCEFEGRR